MRGKLWLAAALLAPSVVALAKTTPYWVCAGRDGVKIAQDRPCDGDQTTIRTPPELTPTTLAQPLPPVADAPRGADSQTAPSPPAASAAPPAGVPRATTVSYQPIVDVAVRGFAITALLVLAVFALRALWAARRQRQRRGGAQ